MAIFGNKSDLVEEEKVDEEVVREYAKEIDAIFGRTSAKTGNGINDSINKLISAYLKKIKESPSSVKTNNDMNQNIRIDNNNQKSNNEGKKCCGKK